MRPRPVLFAGPSIHGLPRGALHPFEARPPARRGDIAEAVKAGAERILLIDGFFGDGPTVSHKEILHALDAGVRVVGAASMGALRAAECAAFGMLGVGTIFRAYVSGRRCADSDVALLHGPPELGYAPLTLALVDVEATLAELPDRALEPGERAALLGQARELHFGRRTWREVVAALPAARRGPAESLLQRNMVGAKARDAAKALEWMAMGPDIRARSHGQPPFA